MSRIFWMSSQASSQSTQRSSIFINAPRASSRWRSRRRAKSAGTVSDGANGPKSESAWAAFSNPTDVSASVSGVGRSLISRPPTEKVLEPNPPLQNKKPPGIDQRVPAPRLALSKQFLSAFLQRDSLRHLSERFLFSVALLSPLPRRALGQVYLWQDNARLRGYRRIPAYAQTLEIAHWCGFSKLRFVFRGARFCGRYFLLWYSFYLDESLRFLCGCRRRLLVDQEQTRQGLDSRHIASLLLSNF